MDDADLYICTESISTDRQIDIRNLWLPGHTDPLEPVPRRPDLQICFDLRRLDEYLTHMRMNYDVSDHPSVGLMQKIINQFWDPVTGSFAADALGIAAPLHRDRL
jgi:hypothetical protein